MKLPVAFEDCNFTTWSCCFVFLVVWMLWICCVSCFLAKRNVHVTVLVFFLAPWEIQITFLNTFYCILFVLFCLESDILIYMIILRNTILTWSCLYQNGLSVYSWMCCQLRYVQEGLRKRTTLFKMWMKHRGWWQRGLNENENSKMLCMRQELWFALSTPRLKRQVQIYRAKINLNFYFHTSLWCLSKKQHKSNEKKWSKCILIFWYR